VSAEGVPVLLDRADVLKALRDALNVTDNRVTQAFGKPWLDDAASRIMAIQPALPASTADARVGALAKCVEALAECLSWMRCDCGHPACKRCPATKDGDEALALAAKSGGGE
jgi:hypothetical protein